MRILLVDDQAIAKTAAASLLVQLGHDVETADSGFEAMRVLTQQTFDIVFLDIEMPGMDGYQTARALRRIRPDEKNMRLYALTASETKDTASNCRRAGMDGWVLKPLRRESLERLGDNSNKGASQTQEMIDDSVVADLRMLNDEHGKPLLFELVRRYQADLPNRLARLWNAFKQRDLTEMQKRARAAQLQPDTWRGRCEPRGRADRAYARHRRRSLRSLDAGRAARRRSLDRRSQHAELT